MTLPVRSQDESVTKLDRGARVRRGRPRHLAPRAAAAASHGTNGGDVKALLRRGVRALAILQTRQRRQPRCSVLQ